MFLRISVLCACMLFAIPAIADELDAVQYDEDSSLGRSPYYNGSFVEFSVRPGQSWMNISDNAGYVIDTGLRHAFPMLLGDTRLAYQYGSHSLTESEALDNNALTTHQMSLAFAVHPLYLVMLANNWTSFVISSLYLELGLGAKWSEFNANNTDASQTHLAPMWILGAGLDIPLWNPNVGYAPWINVVYRYQSSRVASALEAHAPAREHLVFLGLGWRINGVWL